MPKNKDFCLRMFIYIREMQLSSYGTPMSKEGFADCIRDEIGISVSNSTIDNDIQFLRHNSVYGVQVPIMYVKHTPDVHGYYLPEGYVLSDELRKTWRI